jgi:hypothetical protein
MKKVKQTRKSEKRKDQRIEMEVNCVLDGIGGNDVRVVSEREGSIAKGRQENRDAPFNEDLTILISISKSISPSPCSRDANPRLPVPVLAQHHRSGVSPPSAFPPAAALF